MFTCMHMVSVCLSYFELFTAGNELELTSPEQRLSTIMQTQQITAQYSSSPIIFQASTSKLMNTHIAPTASQLLTEVPISISPLGTVLQMTAQPTEFPLSVTTLPTTLTTQRLESTTSPSLNTKNSNLNTPSPTVVQVSTTSEKSEDYIKTSMIPPIPPGRDNQVNSQTMILIAGVSAGCAVLVLLVAIAIVVCSILARSRRAVLVHSSKKANSPLEENNQFEFSKYNVKGILNAPHNCISFCR